MRNINRLITGFLILFFLFTFTSKAEAICSQVAVGGTGNCTIGSGLVLFGNGTSPIATSSLLNWNTTNSFLGVGTSTPFATVSVQGTAPFAGNAYPALAVYGAMATNFGGGGGGLIFVGGGGSLPLTMFGSGGDGGGASITGGNGANGGGNGGNGGTLIFNGGQGGISNALGGGGTNGINGYVLLQQNSGNVGIGTTSPYAKLSVAGQTVGAYFTATTTTASTFPYASTTALTVSGANGLKVGTLNGFLKATTGTVNTASVNLTSDITGILPINNGGTNSSSATTNDVCWYDSNAINCSNNNLSFDGGTLSIGGGTGTSGAVLMTNGLASVQAQLGTTLPFYFIANQPTLGYNAYYNGGWKYGQGSGSSYGAATSLETVTGRYLYYTATNSGGDSDPISAFSYNLIIARDGKTTIGGSSSPVDALSSLDVLGNMAVGSYAGVNAAPSNGLIVSGNVGIGTTTPAFPLDVKGSTLLEPTATPSTSYKGVIWNDSTQNQIAYTNGNILYQGGNLYTATADQTIASASPTTSFSATKVGTTTIAANSLKVGQKFSIWGGGYYSTPLANTSTVTITTSIASSTAMTISTVTTGAFPASATNFPFDFLLSCTVRSIGVAGTLVCDGSFNYSTALSAVAKTSNSLSTVGTIKFDSTAKETLDVKVNWSAVTTQTATVQESKIDFQ